MSDLDWIGLEADQLHLRLPERSEQFYRADRERFKSIFEASLRPGLERSRMTDADREMTLREKWQSYEQAIADAERERQLKRITDGQRRSALPVYRNSCDTDLGHFISVLDQFLVGLQRSGHPTGWQVIRRDPDWGTIQVRALVPNVGDLKIGEIECVSKSAFDLLVTVWPFEFADNAGHDLSPAPIVLERLAAFLGELYGNDGAHTEKQRKDRHGRSGTINQDTETAILRALAIRRKEQVNGEIATLRETLKKTPVGSKITDVRTAERHLPEDLKGIKWQDKNTPTPTDTEIRVYWNKQAKESEEPV